LDFGLFSSVGESAGLIVHIDPEIQTGNIILNIFSYSKNKNKT
jgi:hypothetical protein